MKQKKAYILKFSLGTLFLVYCVFPKSVNALASTLQPAASIIGEKVVTVTKDEAVLYGSLINGNEKVPAEIFASEVLLPLALRTGVERVDRYPVTRIARAPRLQAVTQGQVQDLRGYIERRVLALQRRFDYLSSTKLYDHPRFVLGPNVRVMYDALDEDVKTRITSGGTGAAGLKFVDANGNIKSGVISDANLSSDLATRIASSLSAAGGTVSGSLVLSDPSALLRTKGEAVFEGSTTSKGTSKFEGSTTFSGAVTLSGATSFASGVTFSGGITVPAGQVLNLTDATVVGLTATDIPTLDASTIGSGVLASARIPWSDPGAIGSITPSSGSFTSLTTTGDVTFLGTVNGDEPLVFEGATEDAFESTVAVTDPTSDRTITVPDASGEISLLGQSIANSELVNSSITVTAGTGLTGGGTVTLGGAITLNVAGSGTVVDLSTDTTGVLPLNRGGTGSTTQSAARTALGLGTIATSSTGDFLAVANNLSDIGSASSARTNLGLGSAALASNADFLNVANNLSDLGSVSTARSNLGLVIGSNVQAYNPALASIAALVTGANKGVYATATDTYATYDLTAAGRALLDDADAASQRVTLGLGSAATTAASSYLSVSNNLSDLGSVSAARTNLGLGTAATTAATDFLATSNNLSDVNSASAARANLGVAIGTNVQAYDSDLAIYAGITPSANIQTLLGSANYSDARATLGLAIGTDIQAYSPALTSLAGLTTSANKGVYTTASNTYATYDLTAAGRALLDDADASAQRATLGLGTASTSSSTDYLAVANNLSDLASASTARTNLGLGTAATQNTGAFLNTANNLSDIVSPSSARTNLGLAIGTNVQAYSANLTTFAGIAPSVDVLSILNAANSSAVRSVLSLGTAATTDSTDYLAVSNNLSDLSSVSTARTNLGLGSAATAAAADFLATSNNLSDLNNASTARTNLGLAIGVNVQAYDADLTTYAGITPSANIQTLLGSANYAAARTNLGLGTAATTAATDYLAVSNNLSDLASASSARTNLGLAIGTNVQAYDADLSTFAAISPSVDVQTLLGSTNFSAARTSLGVAIGTDVQAYNAALASIAGLTTSANKGIYTTASNTYATYDLTAAGLALLDDANAAAQRTTLGLGTAATTSASDYVLVANNLSDVDASTARTNLGLGSSATTSASSYLAVANNLSDLASASTARTNLGLVIGTNVQAYDADLTTYAGITPSANIQAFLGSVDYAAARTNLGLGTAATTAATDYLAVASNLSDLASASAARTNLGLAIGTNVQAYDADLTTYAGITPSANVQSLLSAADFAAVRTSLSLVVGTNVQAYDADLTTYAGITPSANVQTLLGSVDFAAARTNLGLDIGTNVQAYNAALASIAGLTTTANKGIYTTASNTYATFDLTAAGLALLDDANAAAQRTTLGLGTAATTAAADYVLVANNLSDVDPTTARTNLGLGTAATAATTDFLAASTASSFLATANNLSDLGSPSTARTNLGVAIGSNVQAYDADLTTYAGITPSTNIQTFLGSADYATARTNLGLGTAATTSATDYLVVASNLSDVSNATTARANLGLAIGTNVQAYDADLTTYAGITPSANIQTLLGSADYAAARTNLGLCTAATQAATDFLQVANNLSDVSNATTARGNLGLGSIATQDASAVNITGGTITLDSGNVSGPSFLFVNAAGLYGAELLGYQGVGVAIDGTNQLRIVNNTGDDATILEVGGLQIWSRDGDAPRLTFNENYFGPTNEMGTVIQFSSGDSSNNMLFAFTKTGITTNYLGSDGSDFILGAESSSASFSFRNQLGYGASDILSSGQELASINPDGIFILSQQNGGVRILESTGGTYYGTLDVGDLGANATYTFSGASGTLLTSANYGATLNSVYQAADADLATFAGITPSSNVQTLLAAANFSAFRTSLGVAIGTDVQAYDAGLLSIANLTTTADRGIYTTASDTYAVYTLTSAGRAILDDADASAQRTTLGLGTIATQAASGVAITGGTINGATIGATTASSAIVTTLQNTGTLTIGDASADTVTINSATWTFANDTSIVLSGGVNGINFDSNTLSIDAENNRIGIGTAAPGYALDVVTGSGQFATGIFVKPSTHATSRRAAISLDNWSWLQDLNGDGTKNFALYDGNSSAVRLSVSDDGTVGIGTNFAYTALDIQAAPYSADLKMQTLSIDNSAFAAGVGGGIGFAGKIDGGGGISTFGFIQGYKENVTSGNADGAIRFVTRSGITYSDRVVISSVGDVRIVDGGLCVDDSGAGGTCPSLTDGQIAYDASIGAFDLAEFYPTRGSVVPGDILVASGGNAVLDKTSTPYDPAVVGVVSTTPNIAFGVGGDDGYTSLGGSIDTVEENRAAVALAGRVPVRVTSKNGVIAVGDRITTSDIPGVGMKATSAGMTVGVALDTFSGEGVGTVMMYVNTGWWNGISDPISPQSTLVADMSVDSLEVAGDATISGSLRVEGTLTTGQLRMPDGSTLVVANTSLIINGVAYDLAALQSGLTALEARVTALESTGATKSELESRLKELNVTSSGYSDGRVTITLGTTSGEVKFANPFDVIPAVLAQPQFSGTVSEQAYLNGELRYVITGVTKQGFTIKTNVPVPEDVTFTWQARQ